MSKGLLIGAAIAVVGVLLVSMVLSTAVASSPAVPLGSNTSPTAPAATAQTAAAPAAPSNPSAPQGHAEMYYQNPQTSGGPHPGTLEGYEIAPSGMTSEDPAVAYDTVSFEPILNIYQTLISYNGSSTSNFVPELSTCVPGGPSNGLSTTSVSCQTIYGQSLIVDNSQGNPQYWTFPISNASFYDPATGAHWQVYPSDVMFSLARTMSFADLPGPGVLNGWIQTQALMPLGDPTWDGGIHAPFNNTPGNIMTSMLINDSTYCPAAALAANGCITFNAFGEGTDWPFFLELVADPLGAGVVPCGWFTAQDAGIPGWSGSAAAHGDGPCLLPGGATNTQAPSFTNYLSTLTPTAWDSFQMLALNHPAVQSGVRFNMVGSGPYFESAVGQTTGYTLESNPYYVEPANCAGVGGGCEPAPGSYIGKVVVTYESSTTEGLAQYEAGQADYSWFIASDTSSVLQLQSEGDIGIYYSPTISTYFLPFDLNFSLTAEAAIDPNAGELNVPGNFFASNTVRDLLVHAYPYTSIENTVWTVDGIQYYHNYGGAIPIGMGNYYPTNVSFPYQGGDPCTGSTQSSCNDSVNSALWWWQQGTNPSSPYYDAELAACTSDNPCSFPIIGELGTPGLDAAIVDYIQEVGIITDGAIVPYSFDLSFPDLVQYSSIGGGQNPMPLYNLGWAPDYPDPTDYMAAMYYANGTYTYGDGTYQVLEQQAQYNQAS
ncbi:MAG TPA: ABC transporter substrate-binding protein, partial [Thermoplasmata archaeon]|nr:ABC transporter substrate-binding protein [Thermoplasmata archaeon]